MNEPIDLAVGRRAAVADLRQRPPVDGGRVTVEMSAGDELPDQRGRPADPVQVLGHPRAAGARLAITGVGR